MKKSQTRHRSRRQRNWARKLNMVHATMRHIAAINRQFEAKIMSSVVDDCISADRAWLSRDEFLGGRMSQAVATGHEITIGIITSLSIRRGTTDEEASATP